MRNNLYATDFSQVAKDALPYLKGQAGKHGATVLTVRDGKALHSTEGTLRRFIADCNPIIR